MQLYIYFCPFFFFFFLIFLLLFTFAAAFLSWISPVLLGPLPSGVQHWPAWLPCAIRPLKQVPERQSWGATAAGRLCCWQEVAVRLELRAKGGPGWDNLFFEWLGKVRGELPHSVLEIKVFRSTWSNAISSCLSLEGRLPMSLTPGLWDLSGAFSAVGQPKAEVGLSRLQPCGCSQSSYPGLDFYNVTYGVCRSPV